jgi:cell division protein FtsW (lipid II flippase)
MPVVYRHTQIGYTVLGIFAGVIVVLLIIGAAVNAWLYMLFVCVLVLLVGIMFGTLTIEITPEQMRSWFSLGWPQRTVNRADIASVEVITYPRWYGYGIRITPHGWMHNVSGRQAVKVTLKNGKTMLFGSDEPEQVVAALRQGA